MKATVMFRKLDSDPDFSKWNCPNESIDLQDNELDISDVISIAFAKYWSAQNRTYASNGHATLDTLSIHSDGDTIGLRFYFKSPKVHNPRKAISADFLFIVSELSARISSSGCGGFVALCDEIAAEAVEKISKKLIVN